VPNRAARVIVDNGGSERVEAISERVRVGLATGHTDVRKGFANESLLMQEVLRRDPLSGHLFCFRDVGAIF
jgi:IS66 Orf2 like protein